MRYSSDKIKDIFREVIQDHNYADINFSRIEAGEVLVPFALLSKELVLLAEKCQQINVIFEIEGFVDKGHEESYSLLLAFYQESSQ
jgi:hypothetical protein